MAMLQLNIPWLVKLADADNNVAFKYHTRTYKAKKIRIKDQRYMSPHTEPYSSLNDTSCTKTEYVYITI